MQQRQQMPHAQFLDAVEQLLAHGFGRADDHIAALIKILGLELERVHRGARIAFESLHQRAVFQTARDRQIVLRRVQQLVKEILGVLGVKVFRLGIGLGDADELQKTQAIRIVVAALAHRVVPIAVGHRLGVLGAEIAQMTEAVVVLDDIFGGGGKAGAGNPHRRMRLLDRPRPQVDHAELIMLAVPGENLARRPRLEHQRQRLAEALALLDRHDAVTDHRVRRQAGGKSGHQPAAADAVEHGVFLGDARRRRRRRQGRAELDDGDVLAVGLFRQHRAHEARIGHEAVDVLVMLVGAHAVKAGLRRVQQFIEG